MKIFEEIEELQLRKTISTRVVDMTENKILQHFQTFQLYFLHSLINASFEFIHAIINSYRTNDIKIKDDSIDAISYTIYILSE